MSIWVCLMYHIISASLKGVGGGGLKICKYILMHFRLFSLTTCNIYLSIGFKLEVDINLSVVIEQCRIHAQCSTSIVKIFFFN